jgi:hypothetical protein
MVGLLRSAANFNPTIDGTWKNFVTDYGAVGDGTTNDSGAVDAWLADTGATKLFIPGSANTSNPRLYHLAGTNTITAGKSSCVISAYGASVDALWIGPVGSISQDQTHSARTNPASAGATSATIKDITRVSMFSVGSWVLMCGLTIQLSGDPPNWYYFEYRKITQIVGATISWAEPLKNTYLDTWPDINGGDSGGTGHDLGGPAMLVALNPQWNTDITIYGLKTTATVVAVQGRSVFLGNVFCSGSSGMAFSVLGNGVLHGGSPGFQPEIDKLINHLEIRQTSGGGGIANQSANNELLLHNVALSNALDGTHKVTTIQGGCSFSQIRCGPTGYGAAKSLAIDSSTIQSAQLSGSRLPLSAITWVGGATGTWKIAKSAGLASEQFVSVFVPGEKLAFCFGVGNPATTKDGGGTQTFTCVSVYADASFFYADTDIGTTKPTPTFQGGNAANYLVNWGADTVTQTNSAPADATVFAAH